MQEIKQDLENLTKIIHDIVFIIKNMEARLSKLEGKTICPNCNGLIELDDNGKNEFDEFGTVIHICKYCGTRIEMNKLENNMIEIKVKK